MKSGSNRKWARNQTKICLMGRVAVINHSVEVNPSLRDIRKTTREGEVSKVEIRAREERDVITNRRKRIGEIRKQNDQQKCLIVMAWGPIIKKVGLVRPA